MDQNTIEKLFKDLDIPTYTVSRVQRAKDLVRHALGGCRPVPLLVIDPASDRMLEVGLICPICLRSCDYPEERIQ